MKLMITGAKGQLGTEICRQLQAGKSALGPLPQVLLEATVVAVDVEDADLTSQKEAAALIQKHRPTAVINCAAYTNVDKAETQPYEAFAVNAVAVRNLAMACQDVGAKLLHLSTDYVFSGTGTRPYSEADLPAPTGIYGATKRQGEAYAMQFCSRWFVVRTSWLYGRTGGNFVKTMLRLADEKDSISVVNDQQGNPTNAEDLAHHLLRVVLTEEYGIYHCTGTGICTWYDFAKEIMRLAGNKMQIVPCTSAEFASPVKRPANSALAHHMLQATVGDDMRPWGDALEEYIKKLDK